MESVQVVIVGAGVAGLAAAKTLGPEINYIIVEAQNYVGGRIWTVDVVPDLTVDLGAQYVHGDKNSVYNICDELNILLSDDEAPDDNTLLITSDGKALDSELIDEASELWEKVRDKAAETFDDETAAPAVSFSDYVPKEFQKKLLSSGSFSENLIQPITDYFMKLEMTETSSYSLSDLNLPVYAAYDDLEGEQANELKNGGYRPFINYLKSFISNGNRIRLNSEVTRVKFDEDDEKVLVEINDLKEGRVKTVACDHVIWTTSLGYLKSNFQRIFADEPDLIRQKQNAITNIGFGTINKVMLIYRNKFWGKHNGLILLHTEKHGSFNMSDSLRQQLAAERVTPEIFETILQMLFRYDALPSTDIPVLICWFVGPAAVMSESLSERLVGQICHEVLCSYMNVPHEQHTPERVVKSAWHSNPYVLGSYSYYSIHATKNDGKQLREPYAPDGVPRVLFAGEATHEGFYSTVNAALETGIRAAETVQSNID